MTISAGTRLDHYEILSPLGAGGMGEVYRARDPRLGRDIAIKVLPASFSGDPERLRRFELEACAASELNHANILAIHDIGTHNGTSYIVTELLEGETLRDRLEASAIPARKALDYALQLARGLAAAHGKRIVHRDLKPENIFITTDGTVKILDFGLARRAGPPGANGGAESEAPTMRPNTDPGAVLGTVGYMSPEQVQGRAADHRADIFSFGVILYEMLSGTRAFRGESAVETMNAILKEQPPELSQTNRTIAPALERVVCRCLEKKPDERFQSASDLAFAIEALSSGSSINSQQTVTALERPPQSSRSRLMREWLPWAVAAVALLLAALAFAVPYLRRAPPVAGAPREVVRFLVPLPDKSSMVGPPVLSPDGRRMVFRLNSDDGKESLWVRPLGSLDAQPIAGTENGVQPFWSPDGRSIGFFSEGKLKRVELSGGPPLTLADAQSPWGGAWSRDGVIIFSRSSPDGLYRVPATGGTPAPVTLVDVSRREAGHVWPYFLPDGQHFLYLARSTQSENSAIYVGSLNSKETKRLQPADSSMAYAPPGYLLFVRESTLMAQGFDAGKLELTSEPFPVAEQVVRNSNNARSLFSVSENGVLAFRTGALNTNQLAWFDRTGKRLEAVTPPGNYISPALSPDEKMIAVNRGELQTTSLSAIWLIDLARGVPTRFTFNQAQDRFPVWAPDGSRIAFISARDGLSNILLRPASGAGGEDALTIPGSEWKVNNDWSPDGRFILFQQLNPKTNWDLLLLPLSGERKPEPFLQTDFAEMHGHFSPDGHRVAYMSNESGQFQIYVQSFPPTGGKWQVSTEGGSQPRWRGDGREIFYFAPGQKLMAVEVKGEGSTFEVGVPRELFGMRAGSFPGSGYYTAARDGKRFLVATSFEASEPQKINVVLDWTTDLKK